MPLYARHGIIRAVPGRRDELFAVLAEAAASAHAMPGCRLYLVSLVLDDPEAIAVTEVWDDRASHAASLKLDRVRELILRARPLMFELLAASEFTPRSGLGWRPLPMNTYVVLEIPSPIAERVLSLRREQDDAFRWSLPAETTVSGSSGTGPLEIGQELDEVVDRLERIARETPPIRARFGAVRRFAGTDIFYLPFEDETPLRALHERIATSGLRFQPSPFPFTPHCTIRTRTPVSDDEVRQLERIRVDGEFLLDTLSLYDLAPRTPPARGFATLLCLLHRAALRGV